MNPLRREDVITIPVPTPLPFGPVNAYLIKRDPLILVDAGVKTDDAHAALVSWLDAHGVAPADLEVILITHGHLDHMGLLERLLEESDATAYAHPYVVERSRDPRTSEEETLRFARDVMRELGVPQDRIDACMVERESYRSYGELTFVGHNIEDGEVVEGLTAHHVPGHSASDTLFVCAASRLAFTGDHILKSIHPNPLLRRPRPGGSRPRSLLEYRQSLQRTRSLGLECCFPGHGPIITDPTAVIDGLLRRQDDRAERVVAILGRDTLTPFDVTRAMFPKLGSGHLYLGLSAATGLLELLEERRLATQERRDGILYYRAARTEGRDGRVESTPRQEGGADDTSP